MKVGIVSFPGTLDDSEVVGAVTAAGGEPVVLDHASGDIGDVDAVVLPGGASFDDHLRPGALARFSPAMTTIIERAHEGLPVLGVGNGFQILCEARLLPGALTTNTSGEVLSTTTGITVVTRDTVWTNQFAAGEALTMALRCASGRYIATPEVLNQLEASDQIVFRYAGVNPTGSANDIAGITNERGTVVGLMAHPVASADPDAVPDARRFIASLEIFLDVVSNPR